MQFKPKPKYRNRKCSSIYGEFDSIKEMNRFHELKIRERLGKITDLKRQQKFRLLPAQKNKKGKVIEREINYISDFTYFEGDEWIVEDVKSVATRTDVYRIKKKLMLWVHGIQIKET